MIKGTSHEFGAVLTGDFIASRREASDVLDRSMDILRAVSRDIGAMTDACCGFERSRGDGWQMFLPDGAHALRAGLMVVAALKGQNGLHSRVAIGLGAAEIPAGGALSAAHGRAFVSAGDLLDSMDRGTRMRLPDLPGPGGAAFAALVKFLDREARGWTQRQAEAMYEVLLDAAMTQDRIAQKLGVTRQAVQSRLSATAQDALQTALAAFETSIRDICSERRS